jgi:hypothetical protein
VDWLLILAWILSLGLPILLVGLLITAIRHWGWLAFSWLLLLGLGGALATVLAQQFDVGWLFQAVAVLAFPLGLILPPTLLGFLFYSAIWFGPPLAAVVVPIIYGVGFALCGMLQVFLVSVVTSRSERRKRFSARQDEVRRLRASVGESSTTD